jgi:choline-sulfatase
MNITKQTKRSRKPVSRRDFIMTASALSLSSSLGKTFGSQYFKRKPLNKPNILIIITDQLAYKAVGALGNKDVKTPVIDGLVSNGVTFTNTYNTCPLCQPVRASFWTGRLPHETNVLSNKPGEEIPSDMTTLGDIFSKAGYETIHFGKTHDAGSLRGFKRVKVEEKEVNQTDAWPATGDTKRDRDTTIKSIRWLKKSHKKPFLAVIDMYNPHNICKWIGANQGPHKDVPIETPLPQLPSNFELNDIEKRPLPVQYICCTHHRLEQAGEWNELNYRHYLAAYYHYVNRVDTEIGLILDALYKSPAGDNTLVVFMADHGDAMTGHRMVTKHISFYEETTHVPFIFTGPGIEGQSKYIKEPLVSLLDLLPTLCDYANLSAPADLRGISLLPLLKNKPIKSNREYVVSQWHNEYDKAFTPGRMLRTKRYKYITYLEGNGEEFYDLEKDPGETRTLIDDPDYSEILKEHRSLFVKYLKETNDPFLKLEVKVDSSLRKSHPLGYMYHNKK